MIEYQKMISGQMYNPLDDKLLCDRKNAKEFCYQYNNLKPSEYDKKLDLIKKIFKKTGKNFTIEPNFYCDYGYNIQIGENFYSNHNLVVLDCAPVVFGDNVFIGPNCGIYTACHPIDAQERNSGLEYAKEIRVGNNVWLGGNVVILAGVTIGDNVVIGAGSVVTKDIPSNCVALGNPCKITKTLV